MLHIPQLLVRTCSSSWLSLRTTATIFLHFGGSMSASAFNFLGSSHEITFQKWECWCIWKYTCLCWVSGWLSCISLISCLLFHHGLCLDHEILQSSFHPELEYALKTSNSFKTSLMSLWSFCVIDLLASFSASIFVPDLKYLVFTLLCLASKPLDLWSSDVCISQFRTPASHIIWESNFLPACWPSVTSQIILSMSNTSMSSLPNSAGPSPGTTKDLHFTTLSLFLNLTVHTPNWSMFELLYIFNTMGFFFVLHNSSIVDLGKRILKIYTGIKLPLAPVSTLYTMQVHHWLLLDSNLVNIMDFALSRLMYFILTTSKFLFYSFGSPACRSPSWPMSWIIFLTHQSCCCHISLHTTLKWFSVPHPLHFLPYIGHC